MFQNLRLLFPRFFLVAQEIRKKTKKNSVESRYSVDYTAIPALPERVSVRALLSFGETSEKNTKKFVDMTEQNLYAVGGTGWFMDLFTNHSNPSSIGEKHSHCLENCSNSVVIGYPRHKLPWKLLTIIYRGEASPSKSLRLLLFRLEFIVNLLRRKTREFKLWIMVRSNPVCGKEDCSQYGVGLVFKGISSYSDQDKLKFIENVWKPGELFDFPASVECSNSNRHFCGAGWKDFPG